jgi:hypothetical protein
LSGRKALHEEDFHPWEYSPTAEEQFDTTSSCLEQLETTWNNLAQLTAAFNGFERCAGQDVQF